MASLPVLQAKSLPKANIMVLYSGDGALWGIADGLTINKHWEKVLKAKVDSDPTWPFDATLEFYDVHSSDVFTDQFLKWRFANASLGLKPPVTAIMGAEVNPTPLCMTILTVSRPASSFLFIPTTSHAMPFYLHPHLSSQVFWAMFAPSTLPCTMSRSSIRF